MKAKGLRAILVFTATIFFLSSYTLPTSAGESPWPEIYVWTFFRKAEWYNDPFYGERVMAYKVGDVARIDILVYNPWYGVEYNIIKVGIRFDWMPRDEFIYSEECSKEDPYVLRPFEWALFPISAEIPDEPGINEFTHIYDVNVVALEDMEEETVGRDIGIGMAVYSQEQAEAVALYERLSQRFGLSPLSLMPLPRAPAPVFVMSKAKILAQRASILAAEGLEEYKRGEFSAAKDAFLSALDLFERAMEAEVEHGRAIEEAEIQQAEALDAQAEAFARQAEGLRLQAEALDAQAEAFARQAEAQAGQVQALEELARAAREQAEALDAQAEAFARQAEAQAEQARVAREQVAAFTVLAWGLTIGTVLIGVGIITYAVGRLRGAPKPNRSHGQNVTVSDS